MFGRLAGWPTGQPSCMSKTLLDIAHKCFNQMFIHAMPVGTSDFYHYYTTFTDLDITLGSQGLCKAKPVGFFFLHTFKLIEMKFDIVLKQFKLNIMILGFFLWRFNRTTEITAVLLTS